MMYDVLARLIGRHTMDARASRPPGQGVPSCPEDRPGDRGAIIAAVLRRLTVADLPACMALAVGRDWGAEEHKWRLLFEVGEVFGLEDGDELVATAVLTRYPPDVGVISMVLVAARLERRGLGTRVMTAALEQAGPGPVYLYATANGRPLYEKLGFARLDGMTTYVGRFESAATSGSRPALDDDLPAILALDAAAFGADRRDLVARLPAFCERVRVLERDGEITGYAGAWRNDGTLVIGPVIADDVDDARTLIGDLETPGDRVRLDVDHRHADLHAWIGVPRAFDTTLMVRGAKELPGDRRRLFLPVMQALG
jgi:ribosomal protein S18 acetylase RimI-like enzyme